MRQVRGVQDLGVLATPPTRRFEEDREAQSLPDHQHDNNRNDAGKADRGRRRNDLFGLRRPLELHGASIRLPPVPPNIASFYQYFPNKEALLFHVAQRTWKEQLARLTPILRRSGRNHAGKLRDFLREFFLIEAAEADLRRALRAASVELRDTAEFRALMAEGAELTRAFLNEAVAAHDLGNFAFHVEFIVLMSTSLAERATDERTAGANLLRHADLLSDMPIAYFKIDEDLESPLE